ncbi:MAG: type III secretion system chaperone [Alphaproteobacteria bacterium]|nr:type III secretion system chaperone [Alphaproteobacteria bacterium]
MADQGTFGQILTAFGRSIGLQDLELDGEGYAALAVDDKLIVNLERAPDGEQVLLYCAVGKPGGTPLEAYAMLLEANYLGRGTGGATLGLASDSDMIVLSQFVPLASLDLPGFARAMEMFITVAEQWSARMPHLGSDILGADEKPGAAEQPAMIRG